MRRLAFRVKQRVIQWYWVLLVLITAASVFAVFVIQFASPPGFFQDNKLFTLILSVVLPLALSIQMTMIKTRMGETRPAKDYHRRWILENQLAQVQDWDELTAVLLQYPRTILPLCGDTLMIFNPETQQYQWVAEWSRDNTNLPRMELSPGAHNCGLASAAQGQPVAAQGQPAAARSELLRSPAVAVSRCVLRSPVSDVYEPFCLPLMRGRVQLGILFLYFYRGTKIPADQLAFLAECSLSMAQAIERIRLHHSLLQYSDSVQEERNRIARYLHDSLGHDLAYLRLKLELFQVDESLQDMDTLLAELKRLSGIANHAYEEVRNSLAELRDEAPAQLVTSISKFAQEVEERANFKVEFVNEGEPKTYPLHVQRQIEYILREILRNIEKHAQAEQVVIAFQWDEVSLVIRVHDDGRGFDVESGQQLTGHYGLKMIQECVEELHGTVNFYSASDHGTDVVIMIPFEYQDQSG